MQLLPSFFNVVQLFCHIYLFWNLSRAFGGGKWLRIMAILLSMAFLAVAFRSKLAEYAGPMAIRAISAWTGCIIILTMWTAARDGLYLCARALDRAGGWSLAECIPAAASIRLALMLGFLTFCYSVYETSTLRINHVAIETDRLSSAGERVRIVALSDLHLVRYTSIDWLERVTRLANAQNPDIVVLLGDIIDDRLEDSPELLAALRGIAAPKGKFAVLGNHEQYRGAERSTDLLQSTGFEVLRGSVRIACGIALAGVDDPRIRERRSIVETLGDAPQDHFVVLLAHRPETPPEARGRFDLQLSGHTHGGQIWPMGLAYRIRYGYWPGTTTLADGVENGGRPSLIHISRGAGCKNPPIRLLAPPDIIVIDVVPKNPYG